MTHSTGACACCGASTRSLFAMGHDARFRGNLSRALATAPGWDAEVDWFDSPTHSSPVTVAVALARVRAAIGRDWQPKVEESAARAGRRRVLAVPAGARPDTSDPVVLRDRSELRADALCAALAGHPLTGQWGFYRADRGTSPVPARVQRTRRDSEESSLIDLWIPTSRELLERVDPARWVRDESAQDAG